jgi:hypothetical protein
MKRTTSAQRTESYGLFGLLFLRCARPLGMYGISHQLWDNTSNAPRASAHSVVYSGARANY